MTAPSKRVRGLVYLRDQFRCVACGAAGPLTFQHRAATGMGGGGKKAEPLTPASGLTMCLLCNQAAEADQQEKALSLGHKLRRNRGGIPASEIPYFDFTTRQYFLPDDDGNRTPILWAVALELLDVAGNLTRKTVN